MYDGVFTSINPDNITVSRKADLIFSMDNGGGDTVTFWNEGGYTAKDIPDIDSGETLAGVSYFYLYFLYGEAADALMEGDGSSITEKLNCLGWSIVKCSDVKIHTYWKLVPEQTMVWKQDSKEVRLSQAVVQFSDIVCNSAVGTTYLCLQNEKKAVQKLPIHKCPMPNVSDLRIVNSNPYIGERGTIGWRVENYASFTVTLDGNPVEQSGEYHEETVDIRYGEYAIEVKNRADTVVKKKIAFPLEIIRTFEVERLTETQATFCWEVEEKNADAWEIKQIASNIAAEGEQTYDVRTTEDREFKMTARPKGSSDWVEKSVPFQMPIIKSFGKGTASGNVTDCGRLMKRYERNGFLSRGLVLLSAMESEVCTSYQFSCKGGGGGGGGSTYSHTYHWSGEHVEQYKLQMDSGKEFGPYSADINTVTVQTDSSDDGAWLIAEGSYSYTVKKHT